MTCYFPLFLFLYIVGSFIFFFFTNLLKVLCYELLIFV